MIDADDQAIAGLEFGNIVGNSNIIDDDGKVQDGNKSTNVLVFTDSAGEIKVEEGLGGNLSDRGRRSWRQIK